MDKEVKADNESQAERDLAMELNFTPDWARTPPEKAHTFRYRDEDDFNESPRRSGKDRGRRPFKPGAKKPFSGERKERGQRTERPAGDKKPDDGFSRDRRRPAGREHKRRDEERKPFVPRLNVNVSFLPARERLSLVVRDIQITRRAFPLIEIAGRFLAKDDSYWVKLEMPVPANGEPRKTICQCQVCRRAFLDRTNAEAHAVQAHLDKWFDVTEVEQEPPAGDFSCVARCGLSRQWLGPPNYHTYKERIHEIWSSRFSHIPKTDYLAKIETVRDEGAVEQWKESLRIRTEYRLKDAETGEPTGEPMSRREAEQWVRDNQLRQLVRESVRCIIPGTVSRQFDSPALQSAVTFAHQREQRFPFTLSLALRPAFRHMHLHLFKVNKKETFVTAIQPKQVEDRENELPVVKEILDFVEAHPDSTRQQVLEGLRPETNPEDSAAAEVILHLENLATHGGLIEFFNGTLMLPKVSFQKTEAKETTESTSSGEETLLSEAAEADAPSSEENSATESLPSEDVPVSDPPVEDVVPAEMDPPKDSTDSPATE